jgi:hypothetical protein
VDDGVTIVEVGFNADVFCKDWSLEASYFMYSLKSISGILEMQAFLALGLWLLLIDAGCLFVVV